MEYINIYFDYIKYDPSIGVQVFTAIGTSVTAIFAIIIGFRQNKINEKALKINDFAELFLMPQLQQNGTWLLLVFNISAYPIYLNRYFIAGIETEVGASSIPNNPNNWYGISITQNIQTVGNFDVEILFEDYLGKKYKVKGKGIFNNNWWTINSDKRVEVDF